MLKLMPSLFQGNIHLLWDSVFKNSTHKQKQLEELPTKAPQAFYFRAQSRARPRVVPN